jgi:UPF0716 protein FxsA
MTFGAPDPSRIPPRRSPARTLVPLAVAAWAVLEIWLLTVVADVAGGFTVLLLLLAGLVLGGAAVKRAGRRAWSNLAASVRSGGVSPDGVPQTSGEGLAMLGGVLLMVPGLISDAVGLLCLFPPTRKLIGAVAGRALRGRLHRPGSLGDAFQQTRIKWPDGKVVQGEVIRDEEPGGGQSHPDGAPRPPLAP